MYHLKKWEIALLCAVLLTALLTPVLGATPGCAWWGAVYPELTPDAAVQRVSTAETGGVILRLRTLEWLDECVGFIKNRGLR